MRHLLNLGKCPKHNRQHLRSASHAFTCQGERLLKCDVFQFGRQASSLEDRTASRGPSTAFVAVYQIIRQNIPHPFKTSVVTEMFDPWDGKQTDRSSNI